MRRKRRNYQRRRWNGSVRMGVFAAGILAAGILAAAGIGFLDLEAETADTGGAAGRLYGLYSGKRI